MKKEFEEYLESMGLAGPLKNRIGSILEDYKHICAQEIDDIFISEFLKEDGTREYISLWLFSSRYMMEAKKFINDDEFDMAAMARHITYFNIAKKEYNFGISSDQSRLSINFTTDLKIVGVLKASKMNCSNLWNIFNKYIKPNMLA